MLLPLIFLLLQRCKMKKIFALVITAFLISGCAGNSTLDTLKTTFQSITSQDTVENIQLAYGTVLSVAVGYRDTCERRVINKSCWKVIARLQPYEAKAYQSVNTLRIFVKNNPNANASAYYQLAKDAISIFSTQQALNGVK